VFLYFFVDFFFSWKGPWRNVDASVFLIVRVHGLIYFLGYVGRNGCEKLKGSVNRRVETVLDGFFPFFAVCLGFVESMFYGFDILVAEFMPSEVSDFFGGYVELTVF